MRGCRIYIPRESASGNKVRLWYICGDGCYNFDLSEQQKMSEELAGVVYTIRRGEGGGYRDCIFTLEGS